MKFKDLFEDNLDTQKGSLSHEHEKNLKTLHDKMGAAYKKHGNVRNDEWRNASRELDSYKRTHGIIEYNPD